MQTIGIEEADAPELSERTIEELCGLFRLLADKPRLRILLRLAKSGEISVTELCEWMQESQPAVSYHLRLMRMAGIVQVRREGKHNFYSLRTEQLRRLMNAIIHDKAREQPCDCFLECVLGN